MMFTSFLKGRRLSFPAVKITRDHALARNYRAEVVLMDKEVSERFTELVGRTGFQTSNS